MTAITREYAIDLLRAVASYDDANQSDLPLPLLTEIRRALAGTQTEAVSNFRDYIDSVPGPQTDDGAAVNVAPSSPDRIEAVAVVMARLHYGDETWQAMSDNGREHAVSLWMTNHPIPDIIAALDAYDREHPAHVHDWQRFMDGSPWLVCDCGTSMGASEADLRERLAAEIEDNCLDGQYAESEPVVCDACDIAARIVRGQS